MEIVLRVLDEEHAVRVDADLALKPIHDLDVVGVVVQLLHQFLVPVAGKSSNRVSKKIPERRTKEKNKPLEENRVVWGVFARGLHLDVVVHIARPPLFHSTGPMRVARLGNDDDRQLLGVFRLLTFKNSHEQLRNKATNRQRKKHT